MHIIWIIMIGFVAGVSLSSSPPATTSLKDSFSRRSSESWEHSWRATSDKLWAGMARAKERDLSAPSWAR